MFVFSFYNDQVHKMTPSKLLLAPWALSVYFMFFVVSCLGYKDGLYSTDDNVVPLNQTGFKARVLDSEPQKIWIVEFYNSWCGHCIHFAPTWKKLAKDWKDWDEIIVIAAIDCSQAFNLEICRQFDITSYPSLKMFPSSDLPDRLKVAEKIYSQDLTTIKTKILDFVTENTPESWPTLRPLEKIEDIWDEKKDHHRHVILIFEEKDSVVGRQVILDTRKAPNILVRTMLKESVAKFGVEKFPSLYRLKEDSSYELLATGTRHTLNDKTLFVNTINAIAHVNRSTLVGGKELSQEGVKDMKVVPDVPNKAAVLTTKINSSVVSLQDLESALHYSFRQEVAICKTIDGDKFMKLRSFLQVLMKYMPGRAPIQGFLSRVYKMLAELQPQSLTGEEWMDKIDRLQDQDHFLPEVIKWESCQGSSARFRGYPCSMWTLFHTLTVSAYNQGLSSRESCFCLNASVMWGRWYLENLYTGEREVGRLLTEFRTYSFGAYRGGGSNPQEVLLAVRGYMEHYFGCEECSQHFLMMAKRIESEISSHKDAVLWLWSAHNKANKRLHGDVSEDPKFQKVQFPPKRLCPKCNTYTGPDSEGKTSWDMDAVFKFLVKFYAEGSIVQGPGLQGFEAALQADGMGVAATDSPRNKDGELDWWEKKQRQQDLTQVRLLRMKKREKQGHFERRSKDGYHPFDNRVGKSVQEISGSSLLSLWGMNQVDLSMCMIFYVTSTLIILLLYHHFIVRRHMLPCKGPRRTQLMSL